MSITPSKNPPFGAAFIPFPVWILLHPTINAHEISNVLLNTNDNNKFNDYAQIKTMKIYVSLKNLHNQNRLEIKNIIISKANFNINKNSYDYVNNYLKNKLSNKKIQIKKSKIFFRKIVISKKLILPSRNKSTS